MPQGDEDTCMQQSETQTLPESTDGPTKEALLSIIYRKGPLPFHKLAMILLEEFPHCCPVFERTSVSANQPDWQKMNFILNDMCRNNMLSMHMAVDSNTNMVCVFSADPLRELMNESKSSERGS
jgi:hypothetical protein